jgi:hypothetical protein
MNAFTRGYIERASAAAALVAMSAAAPACGRGDLGRGARSTTTSGTPWPFQSKSGAVASGEGAGAASSVRGTSTIPSTGGPVSEAVARLARARCDRETSCNRIGRGRAWASEDACVAHERERLAPAATALGCPRGVDGVQLGICLNTIRGQACDDRRGDLAVLPECAESALCAP